MWHAIGTSTAEDPKKVFFSILWSFFCTLKVLIFPRWLLISDPPQRACTQMRDFNPSAWDYIKYNFETELDSLGQCEISVFIFALCFSLVKTGGGKTGFYFIISTYTLIKLETDFYPPFILYSSTTFFYFIKFVFAPLQPTWWRPWHWRSLN